MDKLKQNLKNRYPEAPIARPVLLMVLFIAIAAFTVVFYIYLNRTQNSPAIPQQSNKGFSLERFSSDEEFFKYLSERQSTSGMGFASEGREMTLQAPAPADMAIPEMKNQAPRYSTTNVQVVGIDEPDIVKTDGVNIFYSNPTPVYKAMDTRVMTEPAPAPLPEGDLKVISAVPSSQMSLTGTLEASGQMLLSGDRLVVFSGQEIKMYKLSDDQMPTQNWTRELDKDSYMLTARAYNQKIYVVVQNYVHPGIPCPLPLFSGREGLSISCSQIYHPSFPVNADVTYSIVSLNSSTGEVEQSVSVVGNSSESVIYMSPESLYLTTTSNKNNFEIYFDFYGSYATDLIPEVYRQRITNLKDLQISQAAKEVEINAILEDYYRSLPSDDREAVSSNIANKLNSYYKEKGRDILTTGITKFNLNNLSIEATGTVPGRPLNQFSLDEFESRLRIATTVNPNFSSDTSSNDLYVLDRELKSVGSITNLGVTERIYAVRFIGKLAYMVTFRQTDPFYVIDLSDPSSPSLSGELKIPGYSSYLHPLDENLILGVGREDSGVKLSLFDISNPGSPTEVDKYVLNEYWTEVEDNHRAFLSDSENKVFFLPAGISGFVFGWENNKLNLKKAIADIEAQRAVYIGNDLYIIGSKAVVAYNEQSWEKRGELKFENDNIIPLPEPIPL